MSDNPLNLIKNILVISYNVVDVFFFEFRKIECFIKKMNEVLILLLD